jgi:hypothetical protein
MGKSSRTGGGGTVITGGRARLFFDRVELLLEVNALAEAIGGYEDAPLVAGKHIEAVTGDIGDEERKEKIAQQAGELPPQQLLKVSSDIMCGRDEAAKDDRPKAALEQIPHDRGFARSAGSTAACAALGGDCDSTFGAVEPRRSSDGARQPR